MDIGTAAGRAIANLTASSPPSARCRLAKPPLAIPTTDEEARALEAWADQPPERPAPITSEALARQLDFLASALPARATDAETGRKRAAVYYRLLGDYAEEAIARMSVQACKTLKWFPTPVECLAILESLPTPHPEQTTAKRLSRDYWQGRLDRFLAALAADDILQEKIDSEPEQWRRIAAERGLLRWDGERHVVRRPEEVQAQLAAAQPQQPKWQATDILLYGSRKAAQVGVEHGWFTDAEADAAFEEHRDEAA